MYVVKILLLCFILLSVCDECYLGCRMTAKLSGQEKLDKIKVRNYLGILVLCILYY